jgi:hypothetical protein
MEGNGMTAKVLFMIENGKVRGQIVANSEGEEVRVRQFLRVNRKTILEVIEGTLDRICGKMER